MEKALVRRTNPGPEQILSADTIGVGCLRIGYALLAVSPPTLGIAARTIAVLRSR